MELCQPSKPLLGNSEMVPKGGTSCMWWDPLDHSLVWAVKQIKIKSLIFFYYSFFNFLNAESILFCPLVIWRDCFWSLPCFLRHWEMLILLILHSILNIYIFDIILNLYFECRYHFITDSSSSKSLHCINCNLMIVFNVF